MRLKTFTAASTSQAMALLRAHLGDNAIIVATQELSDGSVRITGATDGEDLDLAELLAPAESSPCAERLAAMAVHHELPDMLRDRLLEAASASGEDDPLAALAQALNELFRFAPLCRSSTGPLLLSGPPGVGKTAAVAKLAARAVLDGHSVAVVTTDTDRAGGLDRLRTLIAPLDLEPRAAPDAATLRRLVADTAADRLLIDSPGINPFRPADLALLSSLLAAGRAEPVLVLAAGHGVTDSAEIGHTYAALGARRMLVTKLDAARRLGGLLAAAAAGLAFGEAGIGPTIGRGLGPLNARGLARLLLHHERAAPGGPRTSDDARAGDAT